MVKLNKCNKCGSKPKFESKDRQIGHNESVTEWWVECECGIRTKAVEGYYGDDLECQQKAAIQWNKKPSSFFSKLFKN
jgi:C4-type Zn-finger protein